MNIKNETDYYPDIDNSKYQTRIIKKLERALGWAKGTVRDEPHEISQTLINIGLGQGQQPLSKWLRSKLLICTDSFVSFGIVGERGICKKYKLNQTGYDEIKQLIIKYKPECISEFNCQFDIMDRNMVWEHVSHTYASEIKELSFTYHTSDNCTRLWHNLQNHKKDSKDFIFKKMGLPFNYDIQACAPNLIYQQAKLHGLTDILPGLNYFLDNPTKFRQHLSSVSGITNKQAKTICTALFCGAKLGANKSFELYNILNFNKDTMNKIQDDISVQALISDINACWKSISSSLPIELNDQGRKIPFTSARKWKEYFIMESVVLSAMRDTLDNLSIKYFLEHDGFRSNNEIDISMMENAVISNTNYYIKLVIS